MDGEDIRRSRRRGEERAKRSAEYFALVPSLSVSFVVCSALPSPPEGRERGRGRGGQDGRPSRRCPGAGRSAARWLRGVAMTSPRSGRGGRPSLSLSADTSGRWGERLAMVWTVKTSDGAEGEARNGRRGRRNTSPLFPLFLFRLSFALPYHHHLKEEKEDEDEAGRMADC